MEIRVLDWVQREYHSAVAGFPGSAIQAPRCNRAMNGNAKSPPWVVVDTQRNPQRGASSASTRALTNVRDFPVPMRRKAVRIELRNGSLRKGEVP